jgi:tRNASer (uridine44-2'-O)-methyltransferase
MLSSGLKTADEGWKTAPEYELQCTFTVERFLQVTDLLLEHPNLNSTHLFRADILWDSAHQLKTVAEKEKQCQLGSCIGVSDTAAEGDIQAVKVAPVIEGTLLQRRVLRRLIPRKPQVDRPLEQWCYIYRFAENPGISGYVVLYVPQVEGEAEMPWYHPPAKSLAYVYEHKHKASESTLSVHLLPFSERSDPLPTRLHRTLISLLQTFVRLSKDTTPKHCEKGEQCSEERTATELSLAPAALKDTILAQHVVQDTYTRLKQQYAHDLITRWVEKTEPSKHVFEDLSIAAFVIELWKQMYPPGTFPGFIDFACGNGVLTYVLIKEGYRGRGFDARRRATWQVLGMEDYLDVMVCVPQPFLDHAPADLSTGRLLEAGMKIHNGLFNNVFNGLPNGLFKPGTFIIANHADELTPWTPLLAALSYPDSPLPFLAIPCCSHALSGAKHRYSPKDIASSASASSINGSEPQPANGDLRALRAAKIKAANHQDDKSMYACLTKKVVALAQEVGCEVELTLMRIPSTRNIGIVGNRKRTFSTIHDFVAQAKSQSHEVNGQRDSNPGNATVRPEPTLQDKVDQLLTRECAMSGGITEAARTWIERAQKLQKGQGRGKVNLGGKPEAGQAHG